MLLNSLPLIVCERWSAPDAPETEWMTADKARRALEEIRGSDGLDQTLISEIEVYLQRLDVKVS